MTDPRWMTLACGVYVALLVSLGALGRRARREGSLSEHVLAGRSIGWGVLLLTLFATQYSGNSLSGFPGAAYRNGLSYIMSVTFMVGIVSGYLFFVPSLFGRARDKDYLTPTDFLADRFASPALNSLSAAIFAFTLCNFLLAQLMAMGNAFEGLTDGRISYRSAVLGGAAVILIYEGLGGLRAVAWTDAIQGTLLLVGLALVIVLLFTTVGSPAAVLAAAPPAKIANPDLRTCITWWSSFLLLGLGAPLYPQAIQRIYAARRLGVLRRALAVMAILPLFAITTVIFIGMAGVALFPDLAGSDQVTFRVLAYLAEHEPLARLPVLLVMMAVLAAIMSTADSALLSLSSIVTKDGIARFLGLGREATEGLYRIAPLVSLLAIGVLSWLAILAQEVTLWRLLEIKFEILIQLSPAFVLGTWHRRRDARAWRSQEILAGIAIGLAIGVGCFAAGITSIGGLHPGVLGVIVNYAVAVGWRALRLRVWRAAP